MQMVIDPPHLGLGTFEDLGVVPRLDIMSRMVILWKQRFGFLVYCNCCVLQEDESIALSQCSTYVAVIVINTLGTDIM